MQLNFNVDIELYGIEIRHVVQIIGMQEITEIPETPHGMKGNITLRGKVILVLVCASASGKQRTYTVTVPVLLWCRQMRKK